MRIIFSILCCVAFSLFFEVAPTSAQTENPGAALLDQATEVKLKASTTDDMAQVIALCIRAKKEGLTGENLNYCNQLLASTQMQRGLFLGSQLIALAEKRQLPPNWTDARKNILNELDEAVKTITDQPLPFLLIAKLQLLPEGDPKRAAEALDAAEKNAKESDQIAQIVLMKLAMQKDPAERDKLLAKIVETNPDPRLLMLHAASLVENKKLDEAIDVLKKILEKDGKNPTALAMLFELLSEKKRFDEAMKVLDALAGLDSDVPNVRFQIEKAKLLARMDKIEDAIKLLNDLREKHTNNPEILITRSLIYFEKKDYDNALKDVDAALRMNDQSVLCKKLKAKILAAKGDTAAAKEIVDELFKGNEDDFSLVLLLAEIKENDKAVELLEKFKTSHPELADKLQLLEIQLLSTMKKSKKALDLLNPLLEKDPDNVELLRIKGNLLLAVNRHTEAVKTFEAVLKHDPDDEMVLNNLSWVLSTSPIDMLRNGKRALELAEKACKLTDYKKAYIVSTLAAAYAELGDFDKAVEWSKKCIAIAEKDPDDSDRLDELKKELESYLKKTPVREAMDEK